MKALALVTVLMSASLAGEDPAVAEARSAEVAELVVLAALPAAIEGKLDDFARETAASLGNDTPKEAVDAVIGRIRVGVDVGRVLAVVGMRINARFSRAEIVAAIAAVRSGRTAGAVGDALTQELDLGVARALARASAAVLGQVGDEMQRAVDENEAVIDRLQREIEAAEAKRQAPRPSGTGAP